jgi:ABC-2 type transport system permease protein
MSLRAYAALARIHWREEVRYFWTDGLLSSMTAGAYALIIATVYLAAGPSAGFGPFVGASLVWYLCLAQIAQSGQSRLIRTVSNQVGNGSIVSAMLRPYRYLGGVLATHLVDAGVSYVAAALVTVPVGLALAGSAGIGIEGALAFLVLLLFATILDFTITAAIGLIAFWTEDAKPYWWVYQKLLFLAGGLVFPLDALGGSWATIAKALPPAYLIYHPVRVATQFSWRSLGEVIAVQAAYIALGALVLAFVWRRAVRKVTINGG